MSVVLSIDIGVQGAIALLTPEVHDMPILNDGPAAGKEGAKDAARAEAIRRWPSHASLFARVKDDGRAEAALIGVAGILRNGGAR
jgi:crossover junction endodeoxyribonuclease RuvC